MADALATGTTEEWFERLRDAQIPAVPYNRVDDLFDDEHLAAVGFWETMEHPTEGTLLQCRDADHVRRRAPAARRAGAAAGRRHRSRARRARRRELTGEPMGRLEGQRAVVSASGGKMGGTIALHLAAEGCDVALNDLDAALTAPYAEQIRAMGRRRARGHG